MKIDNFGALKVPFFQIFIFTNSIETFKRQNYPGLSLAHAFKRDHPYIMSAKGQGGWGGEMVVYVNNTVFMLI